jgi:predicted phosphodiesterase
MKVQIHSDLHLEFGFIPKIRPIAPVLILAGDIVTKTAKGIDEWWEYVSNNWDIVIYVLGNHEFYHSKKTMSELRVWFGEIIGKYKNVCMLDRDVLNIVSREGEEWEVLGVSMFPKVLFTDGMNCFKKIHMKNEKGWRVKISKEEWNSMSDGDREWFQKTYNPSKNTILITHYPVTQSDVMSEEYSQDPKEFKDQYTQELCLKKEDMGELVCVSGHTHFSHDFTKDGVRYISNARGYPDEWCKTGYSEEGVYEFTVKPRA